MIMLSDTPAGNTAEVPVFEARILYQVPIDRVREDPNQLRKSFDAQGLEEMVASVSKHGIIQPVIFRRGPDGTAIVVAGERRVAAAQQVGLTEIPGVFIDGNAAEIALVENLQRQDLTPVEEAEALQRLKEEQQYTDEQLGTMIGKARTTINESLSLNKLPQEIRDACRGDRKLTKSALVEIARKKQDRSMTKAYNTLKAKQEQGRKPREKKDPNEPQAFFDLLGKTGTKIDAVDTSAWSADDHNSLGIALTGLRDKIDTRLAAPPPAPAATTKSKKKLA
jgi:ParB family chromosome partitioning protein